MQRARYSERVLGHFHAPRRAGEACGPSVVVSRGETRLELSAAVRHGRLQQVRFKACGCPHTLAAADALCGMLEGRESAALCRIPTAEIRSALEIPVEKTGLMLLLEDAAAALYRELANADAQ